MQDKEIWRPVPVDLYSDFYQVSNFGRIKRLARVGKWAHATQRSRDTSIRLQEKILQGSVWRPKGKGRATYHYVKFKINNVGKRLAIHRLVAMAFIPNPENKPQVNHKDGNGLNNHADNLEWVTPAENIDHYHTDIRYETSYGEGMPQSKLTREIVKEVRKRYSAGDISLQALADEYGVSAPTIHRCVRRETWRHV